MPLFKVKSNYKQIEQICLPSIISNLQVTNRYLYEYNERLCLSTNDISSQDFWADMRTLLPEAGISGRDK